MVILINLPLPLIVIAISAYCNHNYNQHNRLVKALPYGYCNRVIKIVNFCNQFHKAGTETEILPFCRALLQGLSTLSKSKIALKNEMKYHA
jgi:hypothetical protein